MHVGLPEFPVHAGVGRESLGVEEGVAGGERQPEPVLVHPRQHRVVQDAAVGRVLGLADQVVDADRKQHVV